MAKPAPTELNLHRQSRVLDVRFDDGKSFSLSCEFLRVHSPSAEVQGHSPEQRVLQVGKENVNIERLEPVGHYAIQIHFDDGHSTGIYSWDTLYHMGVNYEELWKNYLDDLKAAGYQHSAFS